MTTTAALLPTPGDPFVINYWLRNYERVWRGEVDKLHVLVNGQTNEQALAFLVDALRVAGAYVTLRGSRLGHGEALEQLVDGCHADVVVLLEDDAYVRRSGAIEECLMRVGAGCDSVIASPRGGMSPELERAALERFGPVVGPDGSSGHGLWPCFLFARRADLLAAGTFAARSWRAGEVVPGLDYQLEADAHTDTFTAAAFRLRAALSPITLAGQYKELWQKHLPAESDPPWFHAGGLSNGDLLAGRIPDGARGGCGDTLEGVDWAHRVWWWRRGLQTAGNLLPDCQQRYREGLEALVAWTGTGKALARWDELLPAWITWDETS